VSCEASLYSGSNTLSSKPRLSPEPVIDLILQLDGMLKRLESSMLDIVKDVEQKKKVHALLNLNLSLHRITVTIF